jgi:hypothetical protein
VTPSTPSRPSAASDADAASAAAENVKRASGTLETQGRQLGSQVTQFLGKIRAA